MMDNEVALYDWGPVVQMLLVGALLALVPILWVWWRNRHRGLSGFMRALAVLTLFLTFDLVLFGAFTRLTDSGLGCPDWPGCYGSASPLGAHAEISAAQEAMPTGPVTHKKAWIEIIHRYMAKTVGALILVMTAVAWWQWRQERKRIAKRAASRSRRAQAPPVALWRQGGEGRLSAYQGQGLHPFWPTITLFWVCLQGAFGAWTVTMKLFPAMVTLHLLGGLILLVLLCAQVVRWRQLLDGVSPIGIPVSLSVLAWVVFAALFVQIALGGWVSTNYAVLACSTFPDCNGSWWPEMQFQQAFSLWRELGHQADGQLIEFPALVAIHYTHRLFAVLLVGLSLWLVARLWQQGPALHRAARWLLAVMILQLLTGMSNVVLDWPIIAAVMHTGGAAAWVVALTYLMASTRAYSDDSATALFTESNWSGHIDTKPSLPADLQWESRK